MLFRKEIKGLSELGVLKEVKNQDPGYITSIFSRDKNNNKHRLIRNLKKFNKHVTYKHFKMNTLSHTLDMRKSRGREGVTCKYVRMPNGLSFASRIFKKLSKLVSCTLRK